MLNAQPRVVLVTGASGFLGKHLVKQLVQEGRRVRALCRTSTLHLEKLGVEVVCGDVCAPESCHQALDGVSEVFHLAGRVSPKVEDGPDMYRLHVEGTRTLLSVASQMNDAPRFVVVSTSGTIAVSRREDEISNEDCAYRTDTVSKWPYYLSKIYQEQTAFQLAEELGLEVIVVNPSLLLGPGDDRGSSTGIVEKIVRGRMPFIPKGGGVAFVDARDAADGTILAMKHGKSGKRYLLSASNMTLEAFMGRLARLAEVPSPRTIAGQAAFKRTTKVLDGVFRRFELEPPIDYQSVEMAEHTWYVDASLAASQLGWKARAAQETLADTVRDMQRRHGLGRFK